ncbi:hypothetical protein DF3PA_170028 [Candidatus Defluviicoccus seviourii]|uniref:Uncharacterized protein n=1 Tax=Candidatus Defluviicoccus seviourii TaxID=2565273 RepID=A0A564WBP2_9PROT|nr:hypothetical protein DF3PA_170028 [Candidatus Defluviicoccus seviourii]
MPSEHIRIPAVDPVARYEANGTQTNFAYPFPIFEPENLEVYLAYTLVSSGYSVTGAGETEGGQVVFATAPTEGTVVTLKRRIHAERTTDFQESGDLRAKVLNDQFDHLTAAVQDVAADITRCIRVPASESIGPETLALPPASERRNKWLGFDADGQMIVSGVASSGTSSGGAQSGLPPAEVAAAGGMWGEIGGTLSAQADLWSTLAEKSDATHNHDAAYVPAGHAGSRGATHGLATTTIAGFMAAEDKVKLNGVAAGAEVNPTPTELVETLNTHLGGTAWQSSGSGGSWGGIGGTLADQTDLYAALAGKAAASHSHSAATIQAAGFLSAADKTKLDGIETFATADMTASEVVDKVNEALGGTSWQTSGGGTVNGDSLQAVFINTVNGATISAGSQGNINFSQATFTRTGASFSVADGEVTINDTGRFFVESDVTINLPVANVKGSTPIYLQSNASGSWQTIVGGEDMLTEAGASAQSAVQNCTGDVCAYLELTQSGTKVRVRAAPQTSYNDIIALANKCSLRIYKIVEGASSSGSGSGSPITWYDEQTQLGQQTKLKFIGAGVGAAVNGDTVEVTIAAQAAAAGGAASTVQFNSSGAIAGAAGIRVKSPANGPGYTNHILHANTYTGGCTFETVAAGNGWWADSFHDVAYDVALQGAVTLKGSVINVDNNNEIASTKVYLRNTTNAAISVTIDTGDGHFTEIIGLTNPFSIDASATKIVYLTARKDASGTVRKAVEG